MKLMDILWRALLLAVLLWMIGSIVGSAAVQLYTWWEGDSTYTQFYWEDANATCITTSYGGKPVIWCRPGNFLRETSEP